VRALSRVRATHGFDAVRVPHTAPYTNKANTFHMNRVSFDDLHHSGIYTWNFLHDLGLHKVSRMRAYLTALKERGLSRHPNSKTEQ